MKRNLKISGIGVDLVSISRFDLSKKHFISRILSDREMKEFSARKTTQSKLEYLAGRFAGKEAYLKAKGVGLFEINFKSIEILNDEHGKPFLNDDDALISISHELDQAIAFVVIHSIR